MIFISPLTVPYGKKSFSLNINQYRNTHHQVLNKVKQLYKEMMRDQLVHQPMHDKIKLVYTLYPKTNRRTDIANVLSIHSKFFEDALVLYELIPDDNYYHLTQIDYRFGAVDKHDARVEIELTEINNA